METYTVMPLCVKLLLEMSCGLDFDCQLAFKIWAATLGGGKDKRGAAAPPINFFCGEFDGDAPSCEAPVEN